MQTIVYSCPFVPAEWIAAHGLRPSRILPRLPNTVSSVGISFGVCPYARAFIDECLANKSALAVVVTTVCDQMRRASELIASRGHIPVFLMNVPATWQTSTAHQLYQSELERLGRFLVPLGGKTPSNSDLVHIMGEYDQHRSYIKSARQRLSSRQFAEAMAKFHRNGQPDSKLIDTSSATDGIPLALIGGPVIQDDFGFFDLLEQTGARIVLNASESGERTLPAPFDYDRMRDEPMAELTRAYFGSIPDVARRPNSLLYQWFGHQLAGRGARGIILRRYVWCDIWHAEVQRMREWTDLPVLDIDVGDDNENTRGSTARRINAFVEMLK